MDGLIDEKDAWHLLHEKHGGVDGDAYQKDVCRLKNGEPLAYVIGWQPFLGLRIFLDSHPLIPRPETEWWVEKLSEHILSAYTPASPQEKNTIIYDSKNPVSVLDLCAGSGAIGCALLKIVPYMELFLGEADPAHEKTIRRNSRENELDEDRIHIGIGDLFAPFRGKKFDIIAANPPYVPTARILEKGVAHFEPAQALYAGVDGLNVIRRIAEETLAHINPGGALWLECDSEHADAAQALVGAKAQRTKLLTDLYGRPRVVVGYY